MRNITRTISLALIIMLLPIAYGAASAEELSGIAQDITQACAFSSCKGASNLFRLKDGKHKVPFESPREIDSYIEINSEQPIGGVYVEWGELPGEWRLEALRGGKWETVSTHGQSGFAHEYAPAEGDTTVRVTLSSGGRRRAISVIEMRVLGLGETPNDIQIWQPTRDKADLLLLVAHPDDEYVFMGGLIPTYVSRGCRIVVAFMTYSSQQRRGELLDALWHAGERHYPVFSEFGDRYSYTLESGYELIGERKAKRFVVELFRKYRPEVVVSHDIRGEYGHGMHMVCADASIYAFSRAASADYITEQDGVWQAKKLYLHLYGENQIMLDWEQPLDYFGGKTALEVAAECYTYHVSQYTQQARVKRNGKWYYFGVYSHDMYDNALYGLYATTVGEDVAKNDFMENINLSEIE